MAMVELFSTTVRIGIPLRTAVSKSSPVIPKAASPMKFKTNLYKLSEGREIGEGDPIWYATGYLKIDFKKPTRMDGKVTVRAKISEKKNKTTLFIAKFFDKNNEITCEGEVLSVRVPRKWTDPKGLFQN